MHPGLRGGAAGHHDDGVRARGDHRADGGEGQVEVGQHPVGPADRQAVEPVAPARHDHPSAVEHRVAGRAERPRGHPDVGVGADHGLDVVARQPAVEVPPVGAVGEEPQRAVGPPPRLGDRLPRPACDDRLLTGGEVADDELGGVPRHRRVVPLQPGQRGAVRGQPRCRDEVRAGHQHVRLARAMGIRHRRVEDDDLVDDVRGPVAVMPFPDADDPGAVRAEVAVGVAVAAWPARLRGERDGLGSGLEPVQALVGPVGEPHHAVAYPPGGAAVLVDGGARVAPLGQQFLRGAVGATPDQLRPPALGRAALCPHDVEVAVVWAVHAVHPHLAEADGRGHDDLGRHGGGPGAEGAFDGAVGLRDRIDHHGCNANGDQPRGRVTCAGRSREPGRPGAGPAAGPARAGPGPRPRRGAR